MDSFRSKSVGQRIHLVPDPAEPLPVVPSNVARENLGLPLDKTMFLFFGGLRWDKGPDIFLEALPLVRWDGWFAVVAGEPQSIRLEQVESWRARLLNPDRLIVRLHRIPEDQVSFYFSAADAVVLPYRRSFLGTSGILQHAAAASKPVIASDVGEVGPLVRDHYLGIVVRPESPQALAAALEDFIRRKDQIRSQVQQHAPGYAQNSDWRQMASKVREVYQTG